MESGSNHDSDSENSQGFSEHLHENGNSHTNHNGDIDMEEEEDGNELFSTCSASSFKFLKQGSVEKWQKKKSEEPVSQDNVDETRFNGLLQMPSPNNFEDEDKKKSVSWGACPARSVTSSAAKRDSYRRRKSSMRKTKCGSKSYWKQYLKGMVDR